MSPRVDGRRARGEERRNQLVAAALAVIARDGIAGLTHRAVAERAGVALASVSYHFGGIDDLASTALGQATDDLRAQLAPGDLHDLARLIVEERDERRERLVAWYELYLLALRRPALRRRALSWLDAVSDAFAADLEGPARLAFQATLEGVCLHALMRDDMRTEQIADVLRLAWPSRSVAPGAD